MNDETLLDTAETLEILKISRKTLYKLMERGTIAPVSDKPSYLRKRSKLLFRKSDVERLVSPTT